MAQPAAFAVPDVRSQAFEHDLPPLLCALSVALLVVQPIASFALAGLFLVNMRADTPRPMRVMLSLVLAVSLALMSGARPLDPSASNDIEGYYEVYRNLTDGDWSELAHYGAGLEVALPLLFSLWSLLLPPLSVNGLMFCLALTSALLMLVWVERSFYTGAVARSPALVGICIAMLNLYFSTQLARQYLSLIVLLYAFTARGMLRQMIWLALACAFHLTAPVFFAIYLLARRGWKGWLAIVLAALLLRLYFAQLLVAFDVLPEFAADKLIYYLDNLDDFTDSDLSSLRMVFLLGIISLLALVARRFRPNTATRAWLAVPWITAAVHYLLLPIPLASLRATLMIHSVAPGLLAHRMLSGVGGRLMVVVLNTLVLYKTAAFMLAEGGVNLRWSVDMASGFLL